MKKIKEKLFNLMEEIDFMDQDLAADVEEIVEMEFTGMFKKELQGDNKRIRKIWFEYCYDQNKDKYLKQFKLI